MKSNQTRSYKWAYLPFVFSSAVILASSVTAAPYGSQQYQPAKQVNSVNHEYVGGNTQLGVSITDDGDVGLDVNQVISESQNSSTSVGLWGDFDIKGEDKGLKGRGGQINHNWYSGGRVNKVTAAYDRNANGHDRATLGYGQETEAMFWEGHVSKGLSGRKSITGTTATKAYDYGVGGSVGTFLKDSNMRVRAGLDHEWSDDVGNNESDAKNTTLSAGIEKFFQGTPHSLGLDVAASKKSGGLDKKSDTDVNGRVSYRYDFGGASIYQPDRRYKRVRVEVPGKAVAPRYAQKRSYKRVPTYKTVATYGKKTVRKPYKQLIKSTMALEGQTFFKLNSAKLIPSAQTRLKQIATEIRRNGYKGSIRITGNTCGLGNAAYDQRLSEQRAQEVRAFLIKNGFNADHLIARGLGKGHPKYPNTPDQGFKNRRVDIEYVSERKAYKTGYRTETQNVRTGTRRVATGFKNVPTGAKNVMVSSGKPGAPRVIWRTEVIPTSPAWIKRAMHNNIRHDRNVSTFTSTNPTPTVPPVVPPVTPPTNPTLPVATDDSVTVETCSMITVNVLENDNQGSGNATVTIASAPSNGTAVVLADGTIKYTPNDNYVGDDSFTYTITDSNGNTSTATVNVTVTGQCQPGNTAPDAVNDSDSTDMNTPVTIDVAGNDTDPENDNLTIDSFTQGAQGGTVTKVNGKLVYTPATGFVGTDTFTYTISDGNGGTDTATVTVTVAGPANEAPVANDDTASAGCDAVTISVLGNDTDPDGDTLSILSLGDPSLGTAVINGNTVVYTPVASCGNGTDTFSYTISDGNGHTATANITVNITGDGGCTTGCTDAEPDDVSTTEGEAVSINVLANDSGSGLRIESVDQPDNGTATIMGSTIKYTPNSGFTGTDSFWYGIVDDKGYKTSALILVYVEECPTACNAD
ncbi:MAG: Ig-like domain-containing protein [Cocleimonas sp.]|nr:Ig-like domain-containing protein [Cocleimonas sp.]